jgi:hypothetical protein
MIFLPLLVLVPMLIVGIALVIPGPGWEPPIAAAVRKRAAYLVVGAAVCHVLLGLWLTDALGRAWRRPWRGRSHRRWVGRVREISRRQREETGGPGPRSHDPSGVPPADWEVFCDGIQSIAAEQYWMGQRADREEGQP